MTRLCKICSVKILPPRTYCSNTCKFSDSTYNLARSRSRKKPKSYAWSCTLCSWGTNDVHNTSGAIVKHLITKHRFDMNRVYNTYPNLIVSVRQQKKLSRSQSELYCHICKLKLHKITGTHLKTHNINADEYKKLYGEIIISEQTRLKQQHTNLQQQYTNIFSGDRLSSTIRPVFSVDEYTGVENNTPYTFQCTTCQFVFVSHLDNGNVPVCRNCTPKLAVSPTGQAQQELYDFIKSVYSGPVLINDRTLIAPKELDIVLPELKLAIEYNGLYWHSELFRDKSYHLQKLQLCKTAGYKLIQVYEDEWTKKKDIIHSKIKQLLHQSDVSIFARNTTISEISPSVCNTFLTENHLQGLDRSRLKYGLFHNSELVAVMTLSVPRVSLGQKTRTGWYELSRWCVRRNTTVVGGASKLIHHIVKNHPGIRLYSYADRRYTDSDNNVYLKCGFTFVSNTQPNYWYFKPGQVNRYHRFNFTKHRTVELGGDPNKTEWENMLHLGYNRIWDCGHLKYELT